MCVVSMIYDHYYDKWWEKLHPPPPTVVPIPLPIPAPVAIPPITPEEIAEFRKLLERAREYDRKNNEPDCELEEKREKLKKLAQELGVEIEFI